MTNESPQTFTNYDGAETEFESVEFPVFGRLEIAFVQTDERRAFSLPPAPVIRTRGEFNPTHLVILDELGNQYEVVRRRSRLTTQDYAKGIGLVEDN